MTSIAPTAPAHSPAPPARVHRFEVSPRPGQMDPVGRSLVHDAAAIGVRLKDARATRVYLIRASLSDEQVALLQDRLLADPVIEQARTGAAPAPEGAQIVEVHPLPGVMDPVAQSVAAAVKELLDWDADLEVSTGWRYDLLGIASEEADRLATRLLANPVIQSVHRQPYHPETFPVGTPHDRAVRHIEILNLSDEQLEKLSREAHLFLSLEEMQAIQAEYRRVGRNPTDIELETLAQTWSEHCVHKTLKSTIRYAGGGADDVVRRAGRPGHEVQPDGTVVIHNLLKSTVAAATFELIKEGVDWTLSVFADNAGVIAFDDQHAVCVKVETHNHPSAIEPYGGAATGVGGCIRDVIGTGLGARPIANTDVFCVAFPDGWEEGGTQKPDGAGAAPGALSLSTPAPQPLPQGVLHPRRVLTQVVAGVRDYGNRMGIPTVAGAVAFDDRYIGNPLVYCGCVGVMPRDKVKGAVSRGDLIVALGGRTGRDGIHGATFSSAELTDQHADEFAHAVQIGNAIEEKRMLDAILRARDEGPGGRPLYNALTDCGAGGFSSAIGEMGSRTGAIVHLDRAPLKYAGLSYTEIWISEAQERMVLAVPPENLEALERICREESVELAVLGTFEPGEGSTPEAPDLQLLFHGDEVGRLSMRFLHDGIPTPRREAVWSPAPAPAPARPRPTPSVGEALLSLLGHPNIASKHWIIRQYDHEVRGNTVLKPLVGPESRGPGNGAVITPVPGSMRGLAIGCGLQTGVGDPAVGGDPYLMALAAIDECVRNLVCLGADPERVAILDNFCWPSCKKPENLATLVRAAEGCYDGAKAYRTPFISGKDSLNNQFTTEDGRTIEIPPTLLITGVGIVHDIARCVTMDVKEAGNVLLLVGPPAAAMGGSHYQQVYGLGAAGRDLDASVPRTDLALGPATARAVAAVLARGLARSAHDVSDGGVVTAVAEMLIAGSTESNTLGAEIDLAAVDGSIDPLAAAFAEGPSRYILEVRRADLAAVESLLKDVPHATIGRVNETSALTIASEVAPIPVSDLREAWLRPLDW